MTDKSITDDVNTEPIKKYTRQLHKSENTDTKIFLLQNKMFGVELQTLGHCSL
jgi:hypothetical protein